VPTSAEAAHEYDVLNTGAVLVQRRLREITGSTFNNYMLNFSFPVTSPVEHLQGRIASYVPGVQDTVLYAARDDPTPPLTTSWQPGSVAIPVPVRTARTAIPNRGGDPGRNPPRRNFASSPVGAWDSARRESAHLRRCPKRGRFEGPNSLFSSVRYGSAPSGTLPKCSLPKPR
jgi:hypothetical protein